MKPSLQLKLGQQLAMTPQLQQAIRLLQLSTLDLQQEIQEALESNPLLEVEENQDEAPSLDSVRMTEENPREPEELYEPEPQDSSDLIENRKSALN